MRLGELRKATKHLPDSTEIYWLETSDHPSWTGVCLKKFDKFQVSKVRFDGHKRIIDEKGKFAVLIPKTI